MRLIVRQMRLIEDIYEREVAVWRRAIDFDEPLDPQSAYVVWPDPVNLSRDDSIRLFELMEDLNLVHGVVDQHGYRVRPTERLSSWLHSVRDGYLVSDLPEQEVFDAVDVLEFTELPERRGDVFIVHGEDMSFAKGLHEDVRQFIARELEVEPVLLDVGRRSGYLWDQFESAAASCGVAVCIWTADRDDRKSGSIRPNVMLETGYFMASLGRSRVIIIRHSSVEHVPSDLAGRVYLTESDWQQHLAEHIRSASENAE